MLVATWVNSSVWKWTFTKALVWAFYSSSRSWKCSPKSCVQDVPGRVCMQMTWSSSLKHWRNYNRSWSSDPHGRKTTSGQHGKNQGPDIWTGARCISEAWQKPLWCASQRRLHKFHFMWWLLSLDPQENCIPGHLKSDASFSCKRCSGQDRAIDGRLMREVTSGREELEVVPSVCFLGDTGIGCELLNSMSSCLSSTPDHFPSPPEEEFTIRVSGVPWSIQTRPGSQPYPTCNTCNVTTVLWFTGCAASPPRTKLARKISWRGCSLMICKGTLHPSTQMARQCRMGRWMVE